MKQPDLKAENQILRDFYDSWILFHKTRGEATNMGEAVDEARLKLAAQGLYDAANKVAKHIKQIRAH